MHQPMLTDLTVRFGSSADELSSAALDSQSWQRLAKDLFPNADERSAWLEVKWSNEGDLTAGDLIVTDIKVGKLEPPSAAFKDWWEPRPCGIWLQKGKYTGDSHHAITAVDILFGTDAVDPRPRWTLMSTSLTLDLSPKMPAARLSIRHGRAKSGLGPARTPLRFNEDGKFKIVQISDTHMVTGVGQCNDAIEEDGNALPPMDADPLTMKYIGEILDTEKPDLVVLTGDQLHHDISDTQTALFKVTAPMIERSIQYAAVFGNHDDEGACALSRDVQMSLLQSLPCSQSQAGPADVDGVGNFYLEVLPFGSSQLAAATLFLLDSHGQTQSTARSPDYDPIKLSQIDWFTRTSQALREKRKGNDDQADLHHLSMAFMHIPLPEYADDSQLVMTGGQRREPTEGPSVNTHFYNALQLEGVVALGCGHDHVNDFCALRRAQDQNTTLIARSGHDAGDQVVLHGDMPELHGPWLCHNGGTGFGGYMSYGKDKYHRRARIWELDVNTASITTWKRVEYANERVDKVVIVRGGEIVDPR